VTSVQVSDTRTEVRRKCRERVTEGGLIPEADARSSRAPMRALAGARSVVHMKKRLFFMLLVTGLILLALAGWTVQGLRWAASGGRARGLPQPA
jgi:hypothetical protein